ncbi:MAG TPA: ferrous iron transport protein A [Gemmata sp.]|jgi:ferrous iron transport protein A|nr:ferrous iron transport protein A [Gemmata sp.]
MRALSELRPGARAEVLAVTGESGLVQRLHEFGLFEGEEIEVLALAPLGDPIEIRLGNTRLSLRKSEAAGVSVRPL